MHIAGPYSLKITNCEAQVCGRHGQIMRRYPASQEAFATEDVRRLQKGYDAQQKRIRDAAPELLEALKFYVEAMEAIGQDVDYGREIIAKAEGR